MQFITTGNRIMTENFTVGLFYTITFTNGNYLACSCNGIGDNFVSFLCTEPTMQFILDLSTAETVSTIELYGGGAGTMNYNELDNKPSINGETLVGNLTTTDLHIRAVPTIDTTDNNKVLTASYVSGVTSYSWQSVSTGTTNYNDLNNKPEINGHALSGNQTSNQLGLATAAQGTLADTAVQPADLASYQPLIDSEHKLSPALVATDTTNQFATQTQLDQITTNKTNILLNKSALTDIINSGGKNSFNISTITYATSVTVSGTTMTMNDADSKQYLNFLVQKYQNTTAGSNIASLNCQENSIYTVEFTKDNTFNTLSMGHNGSQKDGKFRTDVSNLTDGITYIIQFEVINCNKDYGHFSWKNIMITPKSLYQISNDYEDYCPTLAELYAIVKSYHP